MAAPAALIASYLAQARGFRQALGEVNSFVRSLLRPMFDSAPESVRKHAFLGQLLRVQGWLGTLVRLDDPADFQAVLCGERTLFELALDIVLLSGDPSGPEKLIEWEESAKLKQAHLGMKYVKSKGGLPEEHFGWATRLKWKLRSRQSESTAGGQRGTRSVGRDLVGISLRMQSPGTNSRRGSASRVGTRPGTDPSAGACTARLW